MTRFLGLLKVSPNEASRMVHEGVQERRDFVELLVGNAGGTIEGYWLTNVGDWDIVCLVNMSHGTAVYGAASTLARRAAGYTDRERWIELAEVDDVAAVLHEMNGAS